ncbi:hypothetical protein [Spartinivicinus poritis]|uniref:Uncharacterized protein n=1 Tax=Spartinivicinus poritis TaxID=2994640 RepID=A0ABT5U393_9GAMM|nr:hypothetical protein [Spartinivicinus sp. A2-2]MDE1460840.1 hypothetical protein [Spartinivicinus sp. A2-2]
MYRLCKFFVSDIVAGSNILKNGYFPIFKEGERPDHGVLFAANGTCKTTLLSFLLGVFCPEKRRFVQYLQSSGDKTMEQYLIPGRPAVVAVDLVTTGESNLFEAEPEEHIVLGQLLFRHKSATDRVDRYFFIANQPDLFDQLKQQWDELLAQDQPYTAVREFLSPRVQQTQSQKEWEEKLENLGLDPWLMNRQVDFARSEGGIKDAFKFKTEAEFISFFLGCVADMEAAQELRANTEQSITKMQDRPVKQRQLTAVRKIQQQLQDFDQKAAEWRQAKNEADTNQAQLAEAAFLLNKAYAKNDEKCQQASEQLNTLKQEQQQALHKSEVASVNKLVVQEAQLQQKYDAITQQLKAKEQQKATVIGEREAINAADYIASIQALTSKEQTKLQALRQADNQLSPVREEINRRACQYHLRITHEREQLQTDLQNLNSRQQQYSQQLDKQKQQQHSTRQQQDQNNAAITRLITQLESAQNSQQTLPLENNETPAQAQDRLAELVAQTEEQLENYRLKIDQLEQTRRKQDNEQLPLQQKLAAAEQLLAQLEQQQQQAEQLREQLLANEQLITLTGNHHFEPTSAELTGKVEEVINRRHQSIDELKEARWRLESELKQWEQLKSLAVDSQTQQLLQYFYDEHGFTPVQLKAYPDYLTSYYKDDPDQVAAFLQRDPGRFTGIFAANQDIIDKIKQLEIPDWLNRPIIISLPCTGLSEVKATEHYVVTPNDPNIYSEQYINQLKSRLNEQLQTNISEAATINQQLVHWQAALQQLNHYRSLFPDTVAVAAAHERVISQTQTVEHLQQQLEVLKEQREKTITDQESTAQQAQQYQQQLHKYQQYLTTITQWLTQYKNLAQWQQALQQHQEQQIVLNKEWDKLGETIETMQQQVVELTGQQSVKQTELKRLDQLANDVPISEELALSKPDQQEALQHDISVLRQLHDQAQETQRQLVTELGITALNNELNELTKAKQEAKTDFANYQDKHQFDQQLAEQWAAQSKLNRHDQLEQLAKQLETLIEQAAEQKANKEKKEEDLKRCQKQLRAKAKNKITPSITSEEILAEDLDVLLHRFRHEEESNRENYDILGEQIPPFEKRLAEIQQLSNTLSVAKATVSAYEPLWDEESPRAEWPDLIYAESAAANAETMAELVKQLAKNQKNREDYVKHCRDKLGNAFEQLQTKLQDEKLKQQLPAIVDELARHDANSLGNQCEELLDKAEQIALNIEGDLSRSEQFVKALVGTLLQHTKEYHQKLQAAAKVIIPEDVYIYGGKPILKAGSRLDFNKNYDVFHSSIERWFEELIEHGRLPEVNPTAGNVLGAELLYRLLRASMAKDKFGIHLLKCDDTGRHYEPVGKDLGSGGEALTTAVLLYSLLTAMRQKRRHRADERIPAFLIADNPLGVCNRSDFLDAQLKVARSMGIQCVYLTGINDRESLSIFEHRVAIRKTARQLQVDNTPYVLLEVIEQHVETA